MFGFSMGMAPGPHPDVWRGKKKFQMTSFTMPSNSCSMKNALILVLGIADVGVLNGDGDDLRTPPRCQKGVKKKFQMTNFTMPNNSCSMKYALISVPGLANVGVLHGDGDGPRCPGDPEKFQMTNFSMTNNMSSMKYALKTVPGLADVGVPHGDGDGPMELRPEGPDQKSEHTTLISMKN